jgi:Mn2+/Fe2+ NRAMP family transporter
VLLALSTVFAAYIAAGILADPDWSAALHGLVVPELPLTREALLVATATVGTTLAPWGLVFIQSYAVDKRLRPADFRYERIDVLVGAAMTGIIGFFVVVACAATLYAQGLSVKDAADAAVALEPVAGSLASALFGAGLLGAGLLAASILPLSTAYSVTEALGDEAALDDSPREAPVFYGTYGLVVVIAVALVLLPGVSLVPVLFLSQALNAILLLPLLIAIRGISRNPEVMGELVTGRLGTAAQTAVIVGIGACILVLALLTFW